jgi:alkanesulfonate monooxygenase SsuD/methylene tetrahydromethanopterin reductase-like flavin-dependent oxidoreductase (luciferase family)
MTTVTQVPRVGIVFRPQLPPERLAGFVAATEAAGLDDLWLWEDCFREGGLTSAAAALAWGTSLRVGLGLMPVPLRNPALAAMEIATLDRMFPGRFIPALGHGVLDWMGQVGARAASPMGLLREWATAVRSLLVGETVTVAGTYVHLDQVALDWPPATPVPVLVGARGPRTLALAGELADGLVLDAGTSPGTVRQAVATAAAARPHDVVVYLPCGAGPGSAERLRAELPSLAPPGADLAALADLTATGSPADVAGTIRAFAEAGATTVVLQPTGDDPDVAATIQLAGAARAALRASGRPAG